MVGTRRVEGSSQATHTEISPLESLLQRAWLQTHKSKGSRRLSSAPLPDVADEKRGFSRIASLPAFSGTRFPRSDDQEESDKVYFHKSRLDASTVLVSRFSLPELTSYSSKTYVPLSVSLVQWTHSEPVAGHGLSQALKPLTKSSTESSETLSGQSRHSLGATESEVSSTSSVDFERQAQPMASFLGGILTDENLEEENLHETRAYQAIAKEIADLIGLNSSVETETSDIVDYESCWADAEPYRTEAEMHILEQSGAYQAMVKEIAELISPHPAVIDTDETDLSDGKASDSADFRPTEELAARGMMEAYSHILTRHLEDVAINSDSDAASTIKYRTTETDTIVTYFNEDWKLYLQNLNQNFTPTSNFDFNLLLCGAVEGSKVSADNAVPSSSSGSLTELLYRCALAVSQGNVREATDLLSDLRQISSPNGNATQRMAHYFMEALVAKLSGTGEELYRVIINNGPSAAIVFKAIRLYLENCPYLIFAHFFTVKSIVDVFEGAARVHLICYGIQYGVELPSLIQYLSQRPEGAPHLRITGIDSPHPGNNPCLKINETGRRLAMFAKKWGVPFEYVALAGSWESFTARDMNLREDEVLAVSSQDSLHTLPDESVMATSPRELVFRRIRSMNPKLFVMVGMHGGHNAPFFMTRFRESVKHYSAIYEGLDISMPRDDPDRVIVEREIFGSQILNIVACEGQARVERAEPYRQWQNRFQRAGFTQLPILDTVFNKMKAMMGAFHKDYGVGRDDGWFLMGIRNQIVKFCSAWEPKCP
ncbi:scarecrow-like protein 14 [Physcomitrium patens]|uniref:Uncharacterized protein n=1 Tax=Physcomitrium patens TaxID=3218 RepID=A0A2K1JDI6_PHYPA|nr:scarecrow-like transcription factor PAT1 [Physcomitrium patens]PNR39594.1 hypothetical protein PHYPA_019873 [Physcomitrium patens]|eukprot:XP_024397051.1 scarecrow-like transcription factor PAT1 [Physcomitrella patens]